MLDVSARASRLRECYAPLRGAESPGSGALTARSLGEAHVGDILARVPGVASRHTSR